MEFCIVFFEFLYTALPLIDLILQRQALVDMVPDQDREEHLQSREALRANALEVDILHCEFFNEFFNAS